MPGKFVSFLFLFWDIWPIMQVRATATAQQPEIEKVEQGLHRLLRFAAETKFSPCCLQVDDALGLVGVWTWILLLPPPTASLWRRHPHSGHWSRSFASPSIPSFNKLNQIIYSFSVPAHPFPCCQRGDWMFCKICHVRGRDNCSHSGLRFRRHFLSLKNFSHFRPCPSSHLDTWALLGCSPPSWDLSALFLPTAAICWSVIDAL